MKTQAQQHQHDADSQRILDLIQQRQQEIASLNSECGHYNNSNNSNKKNKEKNMRDGFRSTSGFEPLRETDTSCLSTSREAEGVSCSRPDWESTIQQAVFHFWDNGDDAKRRYKTHIQLQLTEKRIKFEYIANMTKDLRDFKKHIAQSDIALAHEFISTVKQHTAANNYNKPYYGKLRVKEGKNSVAKQIEPHAYIATWYDADENAWDLFLFYKGWTYQGYFQTANLSKSQRAGGCKGYDMYKKSSPEYKQNELTPAEKFMQKLQLK